VSVNTPENTSATNQNSMKDVTFFHYDGMGRLRQMPQNATDAEILLAAGATLRLGNHEKMYVSSTL